MSADDTRTTSFIISTPGEGGGPTQLEPLEGRTGRSQLQKPLPPIQTSDLVSPTKGGDAAYATRDTIISIPEGGGALTKQTNHGMISVPGKTQPALSHSNSTRGAVETMIYLQDKMAVHFSIDDGQNCPAGELFEYVMEELDMPAEAREVFSLWLVSDLLELQLKPNHIPFKLVCYWDELLEKYTDAEAEDIERDEPILMFQRNVFYSRSVERKITHPKMLRLLYHEAKENVVDSRYPLREEECNYLAGIQAHIQQEGFRSRDHTAEFYKHKVKDYYPSRFSKKKWSLLSSKESPEEKMVNWHREASMKLQNRSLTEAYKMYLEFCWKLPYYGAAYFRGQIEHPGQSVIRSAKDDPVFVAINRDGVFLIDMDDSEFLLGLLYKEISWEYAEPCNSDDRKCFPCLFLQFKDMDDRGPVTKLLQIFSKEAVLMDAMIDACVELIKGHQAGDTVDSALRAADQDGDGVIESSDATWKKFNRLCLSTFRGSDCVQTSVRKPSIKKKK